MIKKQVLDMLYEIRTELARRADRENIHSYQLPKEDVSGKNLAAGRSSAYSESATKINEIIEKVINLEN